MAPPSSSILAFSSSSEMRTRPGGGGASARGDIRSDLTLTAEAGRRIDRRLPGGERADPNPVASGPRRVGFEDVRVVAGCDQTRPQGFGGAPIPVGAHLDRVPGLA